MARTKNKTAPAIVSDALPQEVVSRVAEDQNAASEHREMVLAQFADGLPYDRRHFIDKCRTHMARSAEEALAAGRCLIVLKEFTQHGEWLPTLDEIGIEQSLARRMAEAALKFGNRALTHDLVEAAKTKTKLFELLVLEDEELAALNNGETVLGITLDDIDRMPASQLRKKLREARANNEALADVLDDTRAERDQAKQDLAAAKRRIKSMTADEAEKELRKEAASVAFGAEVSLTRDLREVCTTMLDFAEQSGTDYRGYLAGMIRHLELKLVDLRQEFDLPDDANPEDFSWMGKEVLDSIET